MENLDIYNIDLKGINGNVYKTEYILDNRFFENVNVGTSEIRGGNVTVSLSIGKVADIYELSFHMEGFVLVACNRCLDDMVQPIFTDGILKVKQSTDDSLENDDMIVIPEELGEINIAWYMYEFIELNIPLKHVHVSGECNEQMLGKLKEYLCQEEDFVDTDEIQQSTHKSLRHSKIDPRWTELKKIIDNN